MDFLKEVCEVTAELFPGGSASFYEGLFKTITENCVEINSGTVAAKVLVRTRQDKDFVKKTLRQLGLVSHGSVEIANMYKNNEYFIKNTVGAEDWWPTDHMIYSLIFGIKKLSLEITVNILNRAELVPLVNIIRYLKEFISKTVVVYSGDKFEEQNTTRQVSWPNALMTPITVMCVCVVLEALRRLYKLGAKELPLYITDYVCAAGVLEVSFAKSDNCAYNKE